MPSVVLVHPSFLAAELARAGDILSKRISSSSRPALSTTPSQDLDLPAEEREAIPTEAKLLPGLSAGVRITPLLRERFFGEFDATTLLNYNQVLDLPLFLAAQIRAG